MKRDRKRVRTKHEHDLESSTRFGDWSLDKYAENQGYVIYHWTCGYWTHTFYTDQPNFCASCHPQIPYPEDLENVYRIANFDLMTTALYNTSLYNDR